MRFPDDVPTLTRGDVTLRAHSVDDLDALVEQCTDPVSVRWTSVPRGYTRDMGTSFLTESVPSGWHDDTEWIFAIEATHVDGRRRFGGSISLRDRGARRAEIAFGAHPGVRGRGVMTTAVGLLLEWGFAERGLETVSWLAERGNFASRRVAWRTGFSFGGVLPRWLDHRDAYPDAWVATLHRDDPRTPKDRWLDVPTLTDVDAGIVLRQQHEDDVPRIVEGATDKETAYWLAFLPSPFTATDAASYVRAGAEGAAAGELVQWTVADSADNRLLGAIGLPRMQRGAGEIGYWTHPDARGRGATSAAMRLVVGHAFAAAEEGGIDLHRLFVRVAEDNVASQRVAEKAGFVRTGTERRADLLGDGSYTDMAVLDLLRDEWETRGRG